MAFEEFTTRRKRTGSHDGITVRATVIGLSSSVQRKMEGWERIEVQIDREARAVKLVRSVEGRYVVPKYMGGGIGAAIARVGMPEGRYALEEEGEGYFIFKQ